MASVVFLQSLAHTPRSYPKSPLALLVCHCPHICAKLSAHPLGLTSRRLCSIILVKASKTSFPQLINQPLQGTWMAQLVKCLTLDFSSGHDLMVHEFEPHIGLCADRAEPAWDPLSLPLPCSWSLSQKWTLKKPQNLLSTLYILSRRELGHSLIF